MTLQERFEALFADKPVATTNEVAEALYIKVVPTGKVRSIKIRAARLGFGIQHIGQNTWIKV
jgi:uncharacterized protein YuzE